MSWFRKAEDEKISELHEFLKNSFANVKNDTGHLFEWIQFLHQKSQLQEQLIGQLQSQLNQTPNSPEAIRSLIESHYAYHPIHRRVEELHRKVDFMATVHDSHNQQINNHHQLIDGLHQKFEALSQPPKQPTLKERIIQKLTSNSKNYVKTVILSFIEKYHKIPALQLKEMLVDEQKICSKSSFYRLLQELEEENRVETISDGKNKLYLAKNPLIQR